jgi:hypothetical protein
MRIDSAGKVGIGTNAPGYQLDLRRNDTGTTTSLGIRQLGSGDASMAFQTTTDPYGFCIGVDGSDSDAFKIATGTTDVGTNTKMKIDTSGNVTKPLQSAFQVFGTNQTDFAHNTAVTVAWDDTDRFDQGSDFLNDAFTAPVTGKYQFNIKLYLKNLESAYNYYELSFLTPNKNYYSLFDPGGSGDPAYWTLHESILADMDAGDTAVVKISAGGTGGGAEHDLDAHSIWSGFLVC